MFNEMAWSFIVQTLSGVVAVFIGIWLALVVERRRRTEDASEREALQQAEYERATDSILGSVVKNVAEAKRVLHLLHGTRCPRLLHADLETAVWYASQGHFTALCRNVDQRVIFSQFFDDVRRLSAFVDFRTNLQAQLATQHRNAEEEEIAALLGDVDQHLAALAEDLRFCGVLLVTDHGKPVHKRLMGIQQEMASA
ncbi:hypothetical protein LYSHEL_15280 [Lysobacter helvus]|uniref:Secreted protein n=2 Tax=Lysobacteraceae TaxID=32033 RepID=A0ABM7Q5C9_9GAMM|nr:MULTISPECIES: hypothetical protein [Lysobacter]BCT92504.1 hypothetical protein LYSCAS_15280 [Lysobacter caseinilyticus]BCT95657.1 hypothetical protein LYSHEL_15280 [Lysobacter helvus]